MKQTPHTNILVFSISCVIFLSGCSLIRPDTWRGSQSETGAITQSGQAETISKDDLRYREVVVPEEQFLAERFAILSRRFSTYDELLVSDDFKTFVASLYALFDTYRKDPKKYEQESAILYDKIIPKIVYENWYYVKKADEKESEILIQAMKRNQFITPLEKEAIARRTKKYLTNAIFIPYASGARIDEFFSAKTNDAVFEKLFLDVDNGALWTYLKTYYEFGNKSGVGYKPDSMEADFVDFITAELDTFLQKMGWSKAEVQQRYFKLLGLATIEDLGKKLIRDFESIKQEYGLAETFPVTRFRRDDEDKQIFASRETVDRYIASISHWNTEEFTKKIKLYRRDYILLQYFGQTIDPANTSDRWLWSRQYREPYLRTLWGTGFTDGFGMHNIFKLSTYTSPEIVKIDWSNESKQ